jgi:hypothetical protein
MCNFVGIFWDVEVGNFLSPLYKISEQMTLLSIQNCLPCSTWDASSLVLRILNAVHEGQPVRCFRAYQEVKSNCSLVTPSFRSGLQTAGVTVIDCPHNGLKEVVDKMLLGQPKVIRILIA